MNNIPPIEDEVDVAVCLTVLTIIVNLFFANKDDNDDDCLFDTVITLNEYDNTHIEMINNKILIDFDMIYYFNIPNKMMFLLYIELNTNVIFYNDIIYILIVFLNYYYLIF